MFPFWWELPLTFFGLSLVVFCLFVFGSLRLFETCLTFKDFGERCPPRKVFQKGKVPFLWKFKGDFPLLETFFFRGTFPSEGGKVSKDFSPFGFTRVTRVIALFRHFSIGAFSASWLSFWGHYFGERCPPPEKFSKFKGDFPLLETFFFRGTFPSEGGKVSKDFSPFGFTRVTRVIALFRHFSIGAFSASWLSFWGHYFFFHFDLGVSNTTWTALCVLFVSVFVCLFSVLVHKKSGDSAATPAECLYYWFWVV